MVSTIRGPKGGINLLKPVKVASLIATKAYGRHADGNDVYLSVKRAKGTGTEAAASWVFLYQFEGQSYELGLGSARVVSVADARVRAERKRAILAQGKNPKNVAEFIEEKPKGKTLNEVIAEWLFSMKNHLSAKTYKHYSYYLRCPPEIGNLLIADIKDESPIVEILKPKTPKTRPVIKNLLIEVFDLAKSRKYRAGLNPARFNQKHFIQRPSKQEMATINHPSMPWRFVPQFLAEERGKTPRSMASLCLEFQILTAVRPGEASGALWSEFNETYSLLGPLWYIPASRMKKRVHPHLVPLSTQAFAIYEFLKNARQGNSSLVFPSSKKPSVEIAPKTILRVIPRDRYLQADGKIPDRHGFRTSFCGWSEIHKYDDKITQYCIAHAGGDANFQAYMREDCLEDRKNQLQDWGDFCDSISPIPSQLIKKEPRSREDKKTYIREYMRQRRDKEYEAQGKQSKPWLRTR